EDLVAVEVEKGEDLVERLLGRVGKLGAAQLGDRLDAERVAQVGEAGHRLARDEDDEAGERQDEHGEDGDRDQRAGDGAAALEQGGETLVGAVEDGGEDDRDEERRAERERDVGKQRHRQQQQGDERSRRPVHLTECTSLQRSTAASTSSGASVVGGPEVTRELSRAIFALSSASASRSDGSVLACSARSSCSQISRASG